MASAQAPGTVLWSVPLGADHSSPAIGSDGTIYLCSFRALYSLSPVGTTNWMFPANDICYSSPTVGRDGTIYFGSSDDHLYAVNPDGTKRWDFAAGDAIMSSPALARDGTIYFGSRDGKFYALNPDGTKQWDLPAGDIQLASPVVADDGTIYAGTMAGLLFAFRPDGSKRWEFSTGGPVDTSPALAPDGSIYLTLGNAFSSANSLVALDADGQERWRNTTGYFASSPVLGRDGTIYVGRHLEGGVIAVNPTNGVALWTNAGGVHFRSYIPASPAVAENDLVYFGGFVSYFPHLGKLYAFNPDGTTNWVFDSGSVWASPTVGADGTVYCPTGNGFFALRGEAPLANSPWPKFRQNLRNTGKLERPELRHPRLAADGFHCELFGETGQSYTLEVSTDLQRWTPLTNHVWRTMPVPFADPAAPHWTSRFYRVASP